MLATESEATVCILYISLCGQGKNPSWSIPHSNTHPLKSTLPGQAVKARGSGDCVAGAGRLPNGTADHKSGT